MTAGRTSSLILACLFGAAAVVAARHPSRNHDAGRSRLTASGLSLDSYSNVRFFVGDREVGRGATTVPWVQLARMTIPASDLPDGDDPSSLDPWLHRLNLAVIAGKGAQLLHGQCVGTMTAQDVRSQGLDLWLRRADDTLDHVLLLTLERTVAHERRPLFLLPVRARLDGTRHVYLMPQAVGASAHASLETAVGGSPIEFSWTFVEHDVPEVVRPYCQARRMWSPPRP